MSTITSLPAASTIDPVNDFLAIDTASVSTTQKITRNTYLGLASAPVGLTDTQTLTNKTLTSPALNTPTISSPTLSGTLSGTYTIGGTPTFPSSVVTLTGSQTLTNKTLTAPTLTNASITADAITGFTVSNNGTIYGISVTGGTIASAAYAAGSVGSAALATNAVGASNLATNAITLGYAQTTSNFSTASASAVQVTGLTVTVTIPSGGRRIKITAYIPDMTNTVGVTTGKCSIWDGTVGIGTQLTQGDGTTMGAANYFSEAIAIAVVSPSAGSKTYNVGLLSTAAGNITATHSATNPGFILVEAI